MEKRIVVALMGAGRAGREHATNLGSLPDVRVALVCDPMTAAAQNVMTEVSGEQGKFVIHAEAKTPTYHFRKGGWERDYYYFFMDRFGPAFRTELVAFFEALSSEHPLSPNATDALESLRIGVAATRSLREGRPVKISEVSAERVKDISEK
jgi:predicted dehydrogenase